MPSNRRYPCQQVAHCKADRSRRTCGSFVAAHHGVRGMRVARLDIRYDLRTPWALGGISCDVDNPSPPTMRLIHNGAIVAEKGPGTRSTFSPPRLERIVWKRGWLLMTSRGSGSMRTRFTSRTRESHCLHGDNTRSNPKVRCSRVGPTSFTQTPLDPPLTRALPYCPKMCETSG